MRISPIFSWAQGLYIELNASIFIDIATEKYFICLNIDFKLYKCSAACESFIGNEITIFVRLVIQIPPSCSENIFFYLQLAKNFVTTFPNVIDGIQLGGNSGPALAQ